MLIVKKWKYHYVVLKFQIIYSLSEIHISGELDRFFKSTTVDIYLYIALCYLYTTLYIANSCVINDLV